MKRIIPRLLAICGSILILAALFILLINTVQKNRAQKELGNTVEKILSLIPEVRDAAPDDRINTDLPLLEVDGEDFAGLLEAPGFRDSPLPIGGSWSKHELFRYPHRYTGSIYDGTLIIGGSDDAGQMDFLHRIEINQMITVTDVTGARYHYRVMDIKKKKSASTEALTSEEADLVLFAPDRKALNYTLVFCDFQ